MSSNIVKSLTSLVGMQIYTDQVDPSNNFVLINNTPVKVFVTSINGQPIGDSYYHQGSILVSALTTADTGVRIVENVMVGVGKDGEYTQVVQKYELRNKIAFRLMHTAFALTTFVIIMAFWVIIERNECQKILIEPDKPTIQN